MSVVTLICKNCGKPFQKNINEYNRRVKNGQSEFFCSCKCAGAMINKAKKKPDIQKTCPVCGKKFITTTKAKGATFCSRSCASKGSVTEARREAGRKSAMDHPIKGDVYMISKALKKREGWKYTKLKEFLDFLNESYEFEFVIGSFVYDLAIIDRKILFEFDGPDHKYLSTEKEKDITAKNNGYTLYRIKVKQTTVIEPSEIYNYLKT